MSIWTRVAIAFGVLIAVVALAVQLFSDGLYGTLAAAPSLPALLAGDWPGDVAAVFGLDRSAHVLRALARGALAQNEPRRALTLLAPLPASSEVTDLRAHAEVLANAPALALRDFAAAGDYIAASTAIDALGASDPRAALALVREFERQLAEHAANPEISAEVAFREGEIAAVAAVRYPQLRVAYERASRAAFARALARAPNDEKYLLNDAYAAMRAGDAVSAHTAYVRAAQVVPDSVDAFVGVAVAAAALGDCAGARTAIGRARTYAAVQHRAADPAARRLRAAGAERVRALRRVRVALDTQLAVGTATGVGVYARDLAAALIASGIEVRALQFPLLDPWRFDRRVIWDQGLLPLLALRSGADVLHATSGTLPIVPVLPTVVTVHDMAWLRVQDHTRAYARAYFGGLMKRLYRGTAAVIADSAFARDEFLALDGAHPNVHVVYPGVAARFAAIVRRPRARPFALAVGTIERRKNLLRAIETLAAVPDLELVAVGPPTPYLADVRARIAELGLGDRVTLRGYVAEAELDALYAEATFAIVPSRYEGFGYAVAEALCAGLPVIAARSSSLIEVAGNDAPLIGPDDAGGWIEAVRALLADRTASEARAATARAAAMTRFAWPRAAAECSAIYQTIA